MIGEKRQPCVESGRMPILWGYATWRVLTVVLRNLIQPVNKRKYYQGYFGGLAFREE